MSEKRPTVMNIPFNSITLKRATKLAISIAGGKKAFQVTTPNPEFLLEAKVNPKFLGILKKSTLNIPDGIGILWASKYKKISRNKPKHLKVINWIGSLLTLLIKPESIKEVLPERVTGTDLMQEICKASVEKKLKIFLLGAKEGVASKTKIILEKKYKNLKIVGAHSGSPQESEDKKITQIINQAKPDILFVAYGAPKQEIWIDRNLNKLKTVKLAIGIGGAFDFITGNRKRAPQLMQKIGLEWLFRLIQEPKRAKRIYNAVIKFPITILTESLKKE